MRRNEDGFTFIEMLLVLAIISLLSFLTLTFSLRQMKLDIYEKTVQQFELDLLEMQALSIKNGLATRCWVREGEELQCFQHYGELLISRHFPEGITANIYTTNTRIEFTGYGTIVNFGRIEFLMGERRMIFSINLGKGRMRLLSQ
ncbi:prepilin-type N-terminal cleavage/methylation domain-containing protein [Metasolibacillus sp. FSL H7-0170]|uniref:prepilin-type N-terminal cleavage/methylation domain-containing protein n=1 Tax=Metasolibacillus sp. FSL H7-0170 TaxID=2921431 RepID=UPI0031590DC5